MEKPTLSIAVADRTRGNYYEFRGTTVIHHFTIDGERIMHYWLKDTPEECAYCNNIDWEPRVNPDRFCSGYCALDYQEPVPCRICGADCRGGDYLEWHFCSRGCMVEY